MLADSAVPEDEQLNVLKELERRETEYMRLKRHKMSVDDFELLTIIGRGAFGEVSYLYSPLMYLFTFSIYRLNVFFKIDELYS